MRKWMENADGGVELEYVINDGNVDYPFTETTNIYLKFIRNVLTSDVYVLCLLSSLTCQL